MAAISGLSEIQNLACKDLKVGDLVLIYNPNYNPDIDDPLPPINNIHSNIDARAQHSANAATQTDQPGSDDIAIPEHATSDDSDTTEPITELDVAAFAELPFAVVDFPYIGDENCPPPRSSKAPSMFVVSSIKKTDGNVQDICLRFLTYERFPSYIRNRSKYSYQIFGQLCVYSAPQAGLTPTGSNDGQPMPVVESIKKYVDCSTLVIKPSPSGTEAQADLWFDFRCPSDCRHGWLPRLSDVRDMIRDYDTPATVDHKPLCPFCMGLDLLKEQQQLRLQLESQGFIDLGPVIEFYGRVNQRLGELQYAFKQFDEREWGYSFDDMLSDDGRDDDGNNDDGQFEQWDEAQDPNNNITKHPASADTIAALPRKTYSEVKPADKSDEEPCAICRCEIEDGQNVVVLPCKHYFCDDGCIDTWLKQFDTCPTCRAQVPEVKVAGPAKETYAERVSRVMGELVRLLQGHRPDLVPYNANDGPGGQLGLDRQTLEVLTQIIDDMKNEMDGSNSDAFMNSAFGLPLGQVTDQQIRDAITEHLRRRWAVWNQTGEHSGVGQGDGQDGTANASNMGRVNEAGLGQVVAVGEVAGDTQGDVGGSTGGTHQMAVANQQPPTDAADEDMVDMLW